MGKAAVPREHWRTRVGMILAAAGSAIGIGNLLRFPGLAATEGGGAFMIPYLVALVLLGLPMSWVAWTVGRMGGRWGHGTTPAIFERLVHRRWAKYAGVIGVALPLVFIIYYTYIEAWCLAYSWFSLTGRIVSRPGHNVDLVAFLGELTGDAVTHDYFAGIGTALAFCLVAVLLNVWILSRGVVRGLELLGKVAIPLLFLFCIGLGVRVFTLGTIRGSVWDGLNFLYTPDLSRLADPDVWMAAAGQIFFTLGIGFGCLECYASYLGENEDVALNSATAASLNEVVEVIFGSLIAIPAAAIFFGMHEVPRIAASGTFNIGMISMPEVLRGTPGLAVFGTTWFLLLFLAALTSSVAVAQPVMAFFEDELKLSRRASSAVLGLLWLLGSVPVVLFYKYGVLDEMDFWAGTLGLVLLATIEAVFFSWVFGVGEGWRELHRGADLRVPAVFRFVLRYVTPVVLIAILAYWVIASGIVGGKLGVEPASFRWGIANRPAYAGAFLSRLEPASDEATRVAQLEQLAQDAAAGAGGDLAAEARVVVHPAAPPRLLQLVGDADLLAAFGPAAFEEWLRLVDLRYEPEPGTPARPLELTLLVEARYRTTAVWVSRLVMAGVFAGFSLLVWRVWRRRPPEGAPA
ncbi:MAG: sodium-dependent transporter [Acidobacteria bacterium]|nr:sodium-dependent transporter [Acidobacteriota bacterium]